MTATTRASDTRHVLPWLEAQQRRIQGILAGLDDDALRQVVLPSGWSCAGMIQHLTVMTRFWFVDVMAGRPSDEPESGDFHVADTTAVSTLLDAYEREAEAAVALIRDVPSDTPPAWWPDGMFGDWRMDDLHEVIMHVLIETTCHAGHLDAARELIDGRTWDYEHGRLSEPG